MTHSPLFKELFTYNHHYNRQLIALFNGGSNLPKHSIKLLNHIVNAHHIWNARISSTPANTGVWDINEAEKLRTLDAENYAQSLWIIEHVQGKHVVEYRNTLGQTFYNTATEIHFHIINHATYHRGQIAAECRHAGTEPMVTDYIVYARNKRGGLVL